MPTSFAYRMLARAASTLVPIGAKLSPKLARGDRERRRALGRWSAWARLHRDPARPFVWFHAPSVGEGLQAEAVLRVLRPRHPDWQIGYSFFSPSAERLASRMPVDVADYLPYDLPRAIDPLLEALAPRALIFTKLDLWPELATRAGARGTRVGMIAGTVSPVSGRLAWPGRALTRPGYATLTLAGAISDADGARLRSLGTPAAAIRVTGDPRFDSALAVAHAVNPADPLLRFGRDGPTLVAGSTWEPDEAVLLSAFVRVRAAKPAARLILVPHEPSPRHLERLERAAQGLGLAPVRLSGAPGAVPLLVVDRVGVLTTLYHGASLAYVGGGFGTAGLHSVLEPAAAGAAVVFGPRWQSSREAGLLLEAGGAVALPEPGPSAAAALALRWLEWLGDPAGLEARGARARAVVAAGVGAAERNAALVDELVEGA